tara:strand:+ start:324 stop:458 length:135 start_codon:yes stop_codon:yes gene_type:complete
MFLTGCSEEKATDTAETNKQEEVEDTATELPEEPGEEQDTSSEE